MAREMSRYSRRVDRQCKTRYK